MAVAAPVGPVREQHRFDEAALGAYLADRLPGAELGIVVQQFKGGQSNPTYLIETKPAPGEEEGRAYVLRKKPPGHLLPSAHLIEREYQVLKALGPTPVPVAAIRLLCEDPAIIGTPFYVMDYVQGRIFWYPELPELEADERGQIHYAMVDTLAALHSVDPVAVGLAEFGKPQAYVQRQIARWSKQYEASKTHVIPAMDKLIAWLPEHAPKREEVAIVHGDFRLDNMIFEERAPRVKALLDWELSTLGHPAADLAYMCLAYHMPHGQSGIRGLKGLDYQALGVPTEDQIVQRYCEKRGIDGIESWNALLAFGLFRIAAIAQGVYARALQGNASSEQALTVGKATEGLAEMGWAIANRD